MDMRTLSRMVPPPAPEGRRLKAARYALAACTFSLALGIMWLQPLVSLWRPIILFYPLMTIVAVVGCFFFFRAKSRAHDAYWTEERRAHHYAQVVSGTAPPDPRLPPPRTGRLSPSAKHLLAGAAFVLFALLYAYAPARSQGVGVCNGKFVNPITDVCWSCLFPLSVGSMKVWPSSRPDTSNPALPVCFCSTPIPRIGIAIGFWEPVRLADVSMKPWCFVNLGGLKLDPGFNIGTKGLQGVPAGGGMHSQTGDWHVHWYFYPLISWLQLVTDFACLEFSGVDIAYVTELDPLWQDSELTTILNPESVLFANPIAFAACAADCVASTTGLPIDELFWCSGCQGVMYPLNGKVSAQYGHVQGSRLAVQRMAFKLHRMGILWGSYGNDGLCSNYPMPIMRKAQYRIQATNPVPMVSGRLACGPFGSHQLLKGGRMIPAIGEDFGYLVWRKRNCCLL